MNPAAPSHPADAFVVSKWSARPTSRDKLARARINQRRHRERVKDRIAELERSLADTQAELCTAQATVHQLETALQKARFARTIAGAETDTRIAIKYCAFCKANTGVGSESVSWTADKVRLSRAEAEEPSPQGTGCSASPWLSADEHLANDASFEAVMRDEEQICRGLAPPGSHESTTPCRDAYALVTAQNFAGLDVASLCDWLRPGFRGALEDGGGCRVENTLLLGLIDYIS
ncbi:hypothetical protein PWT90_06725 [Aphanocladium album]|nr:hypothetical protein PWT90_06725 [Aphanocladium album]